MEKKSVFKIQWTRDGLTGECRYVRTGISQDHGVGPSGLGAISSQGGREMAVRGFEGEEDTHLRMEKQPLGRRTFAGPSLTMGHGEDPIECVLLGSWLAVTPGSYSTMAI